MPQFSLFALLKSLSLSLLWLMFTDELFSRGKVAIIIGEDVISR